MCKIRGRRGGVWGLTAALGAIGATRFELATSWTQTTRSSQAELRPGDAGSYHAFAALRTNCAPARRRAETEAGRSAPRRPARSGCSAQLTDGWLPPPERTRNHPPGTPQPPERDAPAPVCECNRSKRSPAPSRSAARAAHGSLGACHAQRMSAATMVRPVATPRTEGRYGQPPGSDISALTLTAERLRTGSRPRAP